MSRQTLFPKKNFSIEDLFKNKTYYFVTDNQIFQNQVSELRSVLSTSSGMMSYIAKFWRGFYPLLVVELNSAKSNKPTEGDNDEDAPEVEQEEVKLKTDECRKR